MKRSTWSKSLYGLKQSSRCWNQKFTKHMKSLDFTESDVDPCVFVRVNKNKKVEIMAVYGELHYCLGINVKIDKDSISLCQNQYIERLLDKYGLTDANTVSTPMDPSVKLVRDDKYSKRVDSVRYQSMFGSLPHLARATRPDIAHAITTVSKFNSEPTEAHLTAVKRIFWYLKGTINLSL